MFTIKNQKDTEKHKGPTKKISNQVLVPARTVNILVDSLRAFLSFSLFLSLSPSHPPSFLVMVSVAD